MGLFNWIKSYRWHYGLYSSDFLTRNDVRGDNPDLNQWTTLSFNMLVMEECAWARMFLKRTRVHLNFYIPISLIKKSDSKFSQENVFSWDFPWSSEAMKVSALSVFWWSGRYEEGRNGALRLGGRELRVAVILLVNSKMLYC